MLGFLPSFIRGFIALLLLPVNTLFWCALLFVLALVKLVLPFKAVRLRLDPMLNAVAMAWVTCELPPWRRQFVKAPSPSFGPSAATGGWR